MEKKVIHLYRANASKSSRITAQLEIDKGQVLDNTRLLDLNILYYYFFKSSYNDTFVFHQQSSLLNLLACNTFNYFTNKIKIVYDIHDILEYEKESSIKSKLSFFVFSLSERVAFKNKVELLTVSDGLAKFFFLKYKRKPYVFYNIPPHRLCSKNNVIDKSKINKCVYFGQINENRLPVALLEELKQKNIDTDVYGFFASNSEYRKCFSSFQKGGSVKYLGEYDPNKIVDLVSGYEFSLLYFPTKKINIKFCLPNKLFQSFAAGVRCIISDNLTEVKTKFESTGAVISLSDIGKNEKNISDIVHNMQTKVVCMQTQSVHTYLTVIK